MYAQMKQSTMTMESGCVILPGLTDHSSRLITLICGGGKTSLMYLWARCLKTNGASVITAATTKLSAAPQPEAIYIPAPTLEAARAACASAPATDAIQTLYTSLLTEECKLKGLPPEWVNTLSCEFPETFFIVEGDGSAGRPVKGHLPHEPVIPSNTDLLVPVIGLDILGKPASEAWVHRMEVFRRITGAKSGELINESHLVSMLLSPEGPLSKAPDNVSIMPFLNKAETPADLEASLVLARQLLHAGFAGLNRVLIGSVMQNKFRVLS